MTTQARRAVGIAAVTLAMAAAHGDAQPKDAKATQREATVAVRIRGTFDVKLAPLANEDAGEGLSLGRMSIDKRFHGELDGTSKGEMLSALTAVKGSAGYVAIERVAGTLRGRRGSFVLQHSGTMNRGAQSLVITVVPDSATGDLAGLAGRMSIEITDGQHVYDFEYTLPEKP